MTQDMTNCICETLTIKTTRLDQDSVDGIAKDFSYLLAHYHLHTNLVIIQMNGDEL